MSNLIDDLDALKFSKHYLINGWGIKEQERCAQIQICYPNSWALFQSYLNAMGNIKLDPPPKYDLICLPKSEPIDDITAEYSLRSHSAINLEIELYRGNERLRHWHFELNKNERVSSEVFQMAFFLAITDSIKRRIV